jgi:ketosteroid isomerase-like protein
VTSALSDTDKLAAAARFAAATRSDDPAAFTTICAPGAVTWHNFDEVEVHPEQTVQTLAWLRRTVPDLAWTDVALAPTPTGFVSQAVMTGTAPGGPLRVHTCVVVHLDDAGLVTRIEEYLDPAQTAVLRGG